MNGRVLLVGLVVAVLGAAIYLFAVRGGDEGGGAGTAEGPTQPEREVPTPVTPSEPATRAGGQGGSAVAIPADPEPAPGTVEYEREDGSTVRDHRGGGAAPYVRPSLPHPTAAPVSPQVTQTVMGLIRPVVLGCMKEVPETAFGAEPVVMTRATISIAEDGTLTVDEIGPALTDIDENAAGAALDCIRAKSGGLSSHVDHAAVASANLAFPIRPLAYRRDTAPQK